MSWANNRKYSPPEGEIFAGVVTHNISMEIVEQIASDKKHTPIRQR